MGGCQGGATHPCPYCSPLGNTSLCNELGGGGAGDPHPPHPGGQQVSGMAARSGLQRGEGWGQPPAPARPPGTNRRRRRGREAAETNGAFAHAGPECWGGGRSRHPRGHRVGGDTDTCSPPQPRRCSWCASPASAHGVGGMLGG